jgi:hydroxypyruvate isomerase
MEYEHLLPYAVNCSTLLLDFPLEARPAAAAAAGFGWIELWWPFDRAVPSSAELDAFQRRVEDAGVRVACISLANRDHSPTSTSDLTLDRDISMLSDNAACAAELGARLGCHILNRRWPLRIEGVNPEAQDDRAVEAFGVLAGVVSERNALLVLEPVSDVSRYPIQRTVDALGMLERVRAESGAGNVAMMADLYQLAYGGANVDADIATHGHQFGYVQVADWPGRGQPGSGTLPLGRWLTALEKGGYRGAVGLEYYSGQDADPFAWVPRERRGDFPRDHS